MKIYEGICKIIGNFRKQSYMKCFLLLVKEVFISKVSKTIRVSLLLVPCWIIIN
jgi:hypothetical protein